MTDFLAIHKLTSQGRNVNLVSRAQKFLKTNSVPASTTRSTTWGEENREKSIHNVTIPWYICPHLWWECESTKRCKKSVTRFNCSEYATSLQKPSTIPAGHTRLILQIKSDKLTKNLEPPATIMLLSSKLRIETIWVLMAYDCVQSLQVQDLRDLVQTIEFCTESII